MEHYVPLHLAAAFVLANAPWLVARWRPLARCGSWILAYALWMTATLAGLRGDGAPFPPAWELWPVTLALFAVLAFPALAWRYLRH